MLKIHQKILLPVKCKNVVVYNEINNTFSKSNYLKKGEEVKKNQDMTYPNFLLNSKITYK